MVSSTNASAHVAVDVVALEEELVSRGVAPSADVAEYALWLGDDVLILAQQLGWWISRAPELEEDVALGNIALDLLGHARSLLHYAGSADGRTEDDVAYWRDASEFRSAHIVEQPNGDFAHTIVRQLIVSYYLFELYLRLQQSADATLAAIAAKSVKEVEYHCDHSRQWVLRLALGTDESRRRLQTALADLWPYVDELFRDAPLIERLGAVETSSVETSTVETSTVENGTVETGGIAVGPSGLREPFDAAIAEVFAEAELDAPSGPIARGGGREGSHSEYLEFILGEMQLLTRQHPGASW